PGRVATKTEPLSNRILAGPRGARELLTHDHDRLRRLAIVARKIPAAEERNPGRREEARRCMLWNRERPAPLAVAGALGTIAPQPSSIDDGKPLRGPHGADTGQRAQTRQQLLVEGPRAGVVVRACQKGDIRRECAMRVEADLLTLQRPKA